MHGLRLILVFHIPLLRLYRRWGQRQIQVPFIDDDIEIIRKCNKRSYALLVQLFWNASSNSYSLGNTLIATPFRFYSLFLIFWWFDCCFVAGVHEIFKTSEYSVQVTNATRLHSINCWCRFTDFRNSCLYLMGCSFCRKNLTRRYYSGWCLG